MYRAARTTLYLTNVNFNKRFAKTILISVSVVFEESCLRMKLNSTTNSVIPVKGNESNLSFEVQAILCPVCCNYIDLN